MSGNREFFNALRFMTIFPVPSSDTATAPDWLSRCAKYFPAVGICVGLVSSVALLLAGAIWSPVIAALLAVAASLVITGALHEDGLADVGDGFGGGRDRAAKLSIMRDSRLGTYGVIVLLVGFSARLSALASLPVASVVASLVVAHTLARAAIPVLAANMPFARDDGFGKSAGQPDVASAATAVVIAVVLALVCLPVKAALLAVVVTVAGAAAMAALAWRQIGGVTGDVFGAVEQVVETAVLVVLAARL